MTKYFKSEEAIKFIYNEIKNHFGRELASIQHINEGIFISCMSDGKMMSAYWHPTKKHSATCLYFSIVVQKAVSDPGYWAIATANCFPFGNKCKYNVL